MTTIKYPNLTALVLRIGFGLYMLLGHGFGKTQMLFSSAEIKFPFVLGLPPVIGLYLAVFAEFIACIFIIIGFKTRLAAIPMLVTMFVAVFIIHGSDQWFMQMATGGSKEPAMIYLFGFLAIYLLGPGKYSIDYHVDSIL